MKLKTSFLALVLLITTSVYSQQNDRKNRDANPEQIAKNRAETLRSKLLLTDEQYTKVYNELLIAQKEMKKNTDAMKASRDAHEAQMKLILTPEQYLKLKGIQEERKQKRMEHRQSESGDQENLPPTK